MPSAEPEPPSFSAGFLQKVIAYLGKPAVQDQVKTTVIDPLLNHVMRRVFPYIILTCVLFVLLLIAVLITLGIIIFQVRPGAAVAAAASALPGGQI